MIPSKSKKVVPFIIFLVLGFIIMVIIGIIIEGRKLDNFPDVRTLKNAQGIIIEKKQEKSYVFVTLEDGRNIFIPSSYNLNYEPYALNRFLRVGDSIVKPANSDTLYVYRGSKKYYFILEKRINAPSAPSIE